MCCQLQKYHKFFIHQNAGHDTGTKVLQGYIYSKQSQIHSLCSQKEWLAVKALAAEGCQQEGKDADGGDGQLEVAAPCQEGGLTQTQETTCRMKKVLAWFIEQKL